MGFFDKMKDVAGKTVSQVDEASLIEFKFGVL